MKPRFFMQRSSPETLTINYGSEINATYMPIYHDFQSLCLTGSPNLAYNSKPFIYNCWNHCGRTFNHSGLAGHQCYCIYSACGADQSLRSYCRSFNSCRNNFNWKRMVNLYTWQFWSLFEDFSTFLVSIQVKWPYFVDQNCKNHLYYADQK